MSSRIESLNRILHTRYLAEQEGLAFYPSTHSGSVTGMMGSNEDQAVLGKVVCPGDVVMQLPETGVVRIGGGLLQDGASILAIKAGFLRTARGHKLWVEGRQKRYIPVAGDSVVGVVREKHSENFDVDINAPFKATLPVLAFEGATRRNRPNLQPGDLVFCRVEVANRDMEPTLSCVDEAGKAAGFGPLKGGFLAAVTSATCRALLAQPPYALLAALGGALQFEMAVGLNGRVWLDSAAARTTITVANAIQRCDREQLSPAQAQTLAQQILRGGEAAAAAAAPVP